VKLSMEHPDTFPAKSLEEAKKVVVVLSDTVAVTEKLPLLWATAVPNTALAQETSLWSLTVAFASVTPVTTGLLLLALGAGLNVRSVGRGGGVLSST
jgi:hypothetical protein